MQWTQGAPEHKTKMIWDDHLYTLIVSFSHHLSNSIIDENVMPQFRRVYWRMQQHACGCTHCVHTVHVAAFTSFLFYFSFISFKMNSFSSRVTSLRVVSHHMPLLVLSSKT